jgi:hypothetical protein
MMARVEARASYGAVGFPRCRRVFTRPGVSCGGSRRRCLSWQLAPPVSPLAARAAGVSVGSSRRRVFQWRLGPPVSQLAARAAGVSVGSSRRRCLSWQLAPPGVPVAVGTAGVSVGCSRRRVFPLAVRTAECSRGGSRLRCRSSKAHALGGAGEGEPPPGVTPGGRAGRTARSPPARSRLAPGKECQELVSGWRSRGTDEVPHPVLNGRSRTGSRPVPDRTRGPAARLPRA